MWGLRLTAGKDQEKLCTYKKRYEIFYADLQGPSLSRTRTGNKRSIAGNTRRGRAQIPVLLKGHFLPPDNLILLLLAAAKIMADRQNLVHILLS